MSDAQPSETPRRATGGAPRRSSGLRRLTPIAPWPEAGTVDELVRAERVRLVYEQAPPAQALSIVVAALVCFVLWEDGDRGRLAWWFAALTSLTLLRIALALRFRRVAPTSAAMLRWERLFVATLAVVCLAWGAGALLVIPGASLLEQAVVYFFLMGIAGAAVATYSAHGVASAVAITALMLPATVYFAFQPVLELRAMAAGGLIYLGAAQRAIRTFAFFLRRTIQLSFELNEAYGRAHQQSRTDELTGLANRRAFLEHGSAALGQARRYGRPLSLMMFDVDHFKRINDTYGHAAGDEALKALAGAVRKAARASDVPGRLGGEEFALLLPETGADHAVRFAERLRRDIAALVVGQDGAAIRFTCSFGVAERGPDTVRLDELLGAADAALYQAKEAGRDRVVRAGAG